MAERLKPIGDAVHPALKSAGFARRRNTWNRRSDNFVDVVNLQLSKSLDYVWVNLGVAEPAAYERCFAEPMPRFVDEARCTVRTRLGMLTTGRDSDWVVSDPKAASEMIAAIGSRGLAFLEEMHSHGSMERFLAANPRLFFPEIIALAYIRWRLGRTREACETLESRVRPVGSAWDDRAQALGREIGCSHAS